MSDKLQFVAVSDELSVMEINDKLKFVGHFGVCQQYQNSPHSKAF